MEAQPVMTELVNEACTSLAGQKMVLSLLRSSESCSFL